MQTNLAEAYRNTPDGQEAEAILRKCVHCGFCTATCPTYQILGDELDSPRGRIYLIKQVLEGAEVTAKTQLHLDRCLTCRNCETTCPSGVQYGHLIDIGRKIVDEQVARPLGERVKRGLLKEGLTSPLFAPAMAVGRAVRGLLPESIQRKVPEKRDAGVLPAARHARKVLMLAGCVQPAMMPTIDAATVRVLDAIGISTVVAAGSGCCGAVKFHLNDQDGGLALMRANIDTGWPYVERGEVEAIVMNASGCGGTVREYDHHLKHDPAYAEKARRIVELVRDVAELVAPHAEQLAARVPALAGRKVAFHPPCTLQHWQKLRPATEKLLTGLGFALQPFAESHLCCGSAGAYSVLQPEISTALRDRKLGNIEAGKPEMILSSNIGCLGHLQSGTATPVRHWIEAVDEAMAG